VVFDVLCRYCRSITKMFSLIPLPNTTKHSYCMVQTHEWREITKSNIILRNRILMLNSHAILFEEDTTKHTHRQPTTHKIVTVPGLVA